MGEALALDDQPYARLSAFAGAADRKKWRPARSTPRRASDSRLAGSLAVVAMAADIWRPFRAQSYDTKMGELLNESAEGEDMISDWCARPRRPPAGSSSLGGARAEAKLPAFRTEVAETFDSMGLHENLLRGIYAYGAAASASACCANTEP